MGQNSSRQFTASQVISITPEQQSLFFRGVWHEVARSRNLFQAGCRNSMAFYQQEGEKVRVMNTCNRAGVLSEIEGVAGKKDPSSDRASYWVQFPNAPKGTYNILKMSNPPDDKHALAIVAGSTWKHVWVLSREASPDQARVCDFMAQFSKQFNSSHLVWNNGEGCIFTVPVESSMERDLHIVRNIRKNRSRQPARHTIRQVVVRTVAVRKLGTGVQKPQKKIVKVPPKIN